MDHDSKLCLHHIEICVGNEEEILELLKNGFSFKESFNRRSPEANQWVLNSGKSNFIVTAKIYANQSNEVILQDEPNTDYPVLTCCDENIHVRDAVFNVALEVKCLSKIISKIKQGVDDSKIIKDIYTIRDEFGYIQLAVVSSKCKNVKHTLLDKSHYKGKFLPGFQQSSTEDSYKNGFGLHLENKDVSSFLKKSLTEFIDHVTYVCHAGESSEIIKWYEDCFGMNRFFTNKDEGDEGFVLDEGIGLRLKALQYWRCAESGVSAPNNPNDETVLKIVLAEPLLHIESSHVTTFLKENCGPGVQHIGLSTRFIIPCIQEMQSRGVQFRKPPPTYYDECGKYHEFVAAGLADRLSDLSECGILLDTEADSKYIGNQDKKRYLMQVFSHPVFKNDTFFLEVIQRCGATGFGSGNIRALARSIVRYQEEKNRLINH